MGQQGIEGIKAVVGGAMPRAEVRVLKDLGISEVFRGDSSFDDIVQALREIVSGAQRK